MKRKAYDDALTARQHQLVMLQRAYARQRRSAVVVLEGWDAAGKGGIIRRIAWATDPRALRVWSIGAPADGERREHWMQRFWRRVPRAGEIAVFDRSWYGRVLVERVEGLTDETAWRRGYDEINQFESMLTEEKTTGVAPLTWRRRKVGLTTHPTHVTKHRTSPKAEEFSQNFF